MRSAAAVKVGAVVLLALVLVVVFAVYVMGFRARATHYRVCVTFDNAQGLVGGDPVMLAGVKIGQVKSVQVSPDLKAEVILDLDRRQSGPLYDTFQFRVNTSGLIQTRMVEVVPPPPGRRKGTLLEGGACLVGTSAPDLNSLLAQSGTLINNLNRTVTTINQTLTDPKVLGNITRSLESIAAAAAAAQQLAETTAGLAAETQPELQATMQNVRRATADVKATTDLLRTQLARSNIVPNVEEITRETQTTAANLARLTGDLAKVTSNPNFQQDISGSLADIRASAASLKKITADLTAVSGEVKKAAPSIPKAAAEISKIAETTATIRERLKPPQINASFDVLGSPKAGRTFSSGRLDFTTQEGRFLRLGIDDIGENSKVDVQVGERQGRRTLRYGLIRSELGIGLDLPTPRDSTLSLNVFDPNHVKADVLLDLPRFFGRPDLDFLVGLRDLNGDNLAVAGVRLRR